MLDRSLSEVSASWDPLSFVEPADNGIPTHTSLEIGAELEEPGWLPLDDDKMFWDEPQSAASVLDTSPARVTTYPGDKGLQQVDSSFSCGSSGDTMNRFMMFSGDEGNMSPAQIKQPLQPSKSALESLAREVLVINGLPLEARATAMGVWMKKVQRYGGDVYNQVVQLAVGMLSTMPSTPLSTSDKAGSGCLDAPTSSDSERSGLKRGRCDEDPMSSSWRSFSCAASKRHRTQTPGFSNDNDSEGGHLSLSNSHSRSSSFMISTPSTETSRAFTCSQRFTLAEMDQQLGALMSDEPLWTDAPSGLAADPFSVPNVGIPSNNSKKMDGMFWDSAGLQIVDEAPGTDLSPMFMQALYTMCNDGAGQLVDL